MMNRENATIGTMNRTENCGLLSFFAQISQFGTVVAGGGCSFRQ